MNISQLKTLSSEKPGKQQLPAAWKDDPIISKVLYPAAHIVNNQLSAEYVIYFLPEKFREIEL